MDDKQLILRVIIVIVVVVVVVIRGEGFVGLVQHSPTTVFARC